MPISNSIISFFLKNQMTWSLWLRHGNCFWKFPQFLVGISKKNRSCRKIFDLYASIFFSRICNVLFDVNTHHSYYSYINEKKKSFFCVCPCPGKVVWSCLLVAFDAGFLKTMGSLNNSNNSLFDNIIIASHIIVHIGQSVTSYRRSKNSLIEYSFFQEKFFQTFFEGHH